MMQIIHASHDEAMRILKENIDKLHEIAAYLQEQETITGEEFMRILNSEQKTTPALT